MNAGLAQGFVRFGTLAHHILLLAHEEKIVSNMLIRIYLRDRTIEADKSPAAIAANLKRLVDHKFLYEVGRDRVPGRRSFKLFALDYRAKNGAHKYQMRTPAQRQADYRARQRVKVPSVFNWRGSLEISGRSDVLGWGTGTHSPQKGSRRKEAMDS